MRRKVGVVIFVLAGASACSLIVSTSGLSGGPDPDDASTESSFDGGAGDASREAGDAGADANPNACPGTHGPTMVRIGVDGGPSFCIDSTEVTNAQYAEFLASGPATSGALVPTACQLQTSFMPSTGWPAPAAKAMHPVVYVDWCDAYAFCVWAGKRLCGKIAGGPDAPANHDNAATNQQYFACSRAATSLYPYGDSYDPNACNGTDHGVGDTVPVGSLSTCQGAFPGVFDLVGNVCEWQDACDSDVPDAVCLDGPGSYLFPPDAGASGTRCSYGDMTHRNNHVDNIGFRCCGP